MGFAWTIFRITVLWTWCSNKTSLCSLETWRLLLCDLLILTRKTIKSASHWAGTAIGARVRSPSSSHLQLRLPTMGCETSSTHHQKHTRNFSMCLKALPWSHDATASCKWSCKRSCLVANVLENWKMTCCQSTWKRVKTLRVANSSQVI